MSNPPLSQEEAQKRVDANKYPTLSQLEERDRNFRNGEIPSEPYVEDRADKIAALSEMTDEQAQAALLHAPKRVFFAFYAILLAMAAGFIWYAWGSTTVRAEYQGIATYGKHCSAYHEVRWMTPEDQELNRPDRWKLYAMRTDHATDLTLNTPKGSCQANDPAGCCKLFGKSLTPIEPKNLWDKPTWELPKEWQ